MNEEAFARALISCTRPDSQTMREVHQRHGVDVWADLRAGRGSSTVSARAQALDIDDVRRQLDGLQRINADFITPEDLRWPTSLDDLPVDQRPVGLWVRGAADIRVASTQAVAIVGSRACTSYGERLALSMAGDLAHKGWTITSGGAFGIDAAAHRGALAVGGTTVAVLANGVDVAYPRAHDRLFEDIAAQGVLVSEVAPGEPPARFRFLERNRLIAALSKGTVVIEASTRSGALSTAARARALGREVMAVPGPVTSTASTGTHALIRSGAASLVAHADDVADLIDVLDPMRTWTREVIDPRDELDALSRQLMDALPARGARSLAFLVNKTGANAAVVQSRLGTLALRELIESHAGQWRLTDVGRSSTRR